MGLTFFALILAAPVARAATAVSLSVTPVRQVHNLDCEAAALQMALGAIGINVSQDGILAEMGDDPRAPVGPSGHPTQWGDPYAAFVGSTNGRMMFTGYGVYGPPIAAAARILGAVATPEVGVAPSALYAAVASGTPVVVWVTHLLVPPSVGQWIAWDGTPTWYSPQEHAQTLVGVNTAAGTVTLADPWDGLLHTYSMSLFESRFAAFDGTAVFVSPPDGPAVVATTPGDGQAVFWKGPDGGLWRASGGAHNVGASTEISAAAAMASAPAVAVTPLGQQVVFWRGTDSLLHEMWSQASAWIGPGLVSGSAVMASAPTVFVTATDQQAVFWQGPGGSLREMWWQPSGGWNGPTSVPGVAGVSSTPAGFVDASGQQALFWRTSNDNLAEVWWDPGDLLWHGPVGVTTSSPMETGPAAAVLANGQQIVFWEGRDSSLNETWWTYGPGWSGVASWPFGAIASTPAVDVDAQQRQTVFWKGADGNAWTVQFSGAWSVPADLKVGPVT